MTIDESEVQLYDLTLPPDWEQVPLAPSDYDAWITSQLDVPDLGAEDQKNLRVMLRSVMVEAKGDGLVMAAAYVDTVDDADSPVGVELLLASMFAYAEVNESLQGIRTPYAWLTALKAYERDGLTTFLKPPEIVALAERDFVKAVSLDTVSGIDMWPDATLFGVTYYLSLGDGRVATTVGFRTPCLWLTSEFEDVFDAIMQTIRFPEDAEAERNATIGINGAEPARG